MIEKNAKTVAKTKGYNKKKFIIPLVIYGIGFIICFIFAQLSEEINVGAVVGYIVISAGTILFFSAWVKEKYRLGRKIGFPLSLIFPSYPVVEDYDELTRSMSSFKTAYSEFMNNKDRNKDNSTLQNHATQLLWHCIHLQKRRLEKLGIQIDLQSSRRSYSKCSNGVRAATYFDGRYDVTDAYEEIYATRTYWQGGRTIKQLYDKEVARYTFLSAKNIGADQVVCPNCGSVSSKSNLIDGCDFCGTKFTIEDLSGRVANFGFRRDFEVEEGKRQAIRKLIYPWVCLGVMMPLINIGFFMPFFYRKDLNVFVQFLTGLVNAFVFGAGGFLMATLTMLLLVPLAFVSSAFLEELGLNQKLVYRSRKEWDREIKWAEKVRKQDPLFSIQSFFGGLENKIYAIHFANTKNEVNAFSNCDLSEHLQNYQEVVDVETLSLMLNAYQIKEGVQTAVVGAILLLREFKNNKIETRKELVRMYLEKKEDCKTQAVCAPSILRCSKCGSSLSLLEGKICQYCGSELDMKEHDWVITKYF